MGFVRNLVCEQYFLSAPVSTASFAHKTVLITGADDGLGREAARYISKLDCSRLFLEVRNMKAGGKARKELIAYFIIHARPAEMGVSAIVNAACAEWKINGQFLSSNKVHKAVI